MKRKKNAITGRDWECDQPCADAARRSHLKRRPRRLSLFWLFEFAIVLTQMRLLKSAALLPPRFHLRTNSNDERRGALLPEGEPCHANAQKKNKG